MELREQVTEAFAEALKARDLEIFPEKFDDYIEEIIENMWLEFDSTVEGILHEL